MVKQILTRDTKQARKEARTGVALDTILPSTLKRYDSALIVFFRWVRFNSVVIQSLYQLGSVVCLYIQECWHEGEPVNLVGDTLSALFLL